MMSSPCRLIIFSWIFLNNFCSFYVSCLQTYANVLSIFVAQFTKGVCIVFMLCLCFLVDVSFYGRNSSCSKFFSVLSLWIHLASIWMGSESGVRYVMMPKTSFILRYLQTKWISTNMVMMNEWIFYMICE